jgi:Cu/Ag efflux protein CusF
VIKEFKNVEINNVVRVCCCLGIGCKCVSCRRYAGHQGHGVVNKINVSARKINISHDAIPSMNWPGMTMDFKVQNKADLATIKPGMKVDFELTVQGKGYQITHITPAKE